MTLNTAAVMPSNTCTATNRNGSFTVANSTPRIASAAKPSSSSGRRPHCCALRPTEGDASATITCGTTMHAAINTGAHRLERVVTTPAISRSIAALASCSSNTLPAKIRRGRWRISFRTLVAPASGSPEATVPCARATSISRSRMRPSESRVGMASRKVTRNTERLDRRYPQVPITAAATPLPSDAKRALRPNRSPIASGPTKPRLTAAIAGPSTRLAAACKVAAATTTGKIGHAAYPSALTPIVATARPATSRSERAASTMAPPGIWPTSATRPPIDNTKPIETWVHFCVVRYTAMNGPNPVWTSARKKMNQSRPRRLWRDGAGNGDEARVSGAGGGDGSPSPPVGRWSIRWIGRLGERANSLLLQMSGGERQQGARRAEHHDRRVFLVFGRRLYLVLGQFKRDAFALVGDLWEMQRGPVKDDFPAADAEKAAEIDHGRAHLTGAIDDHVDDSPHILACRAAHIAPQNAMRIRRFDNRDGGRRRRGLFRRGRGNGFLFLSRRALIRWRRSGVIACPCCASRKRCNDDGKERKLRSCAHTASRNPRSKGCELKRGRPDRQPLTSFNGTGDAPLSTGIADQSSISMRDQGAPPSTREHDRHLNLAAPAQDFQRYVVAVATDPEVDAGRAQFQFAQNHLVKERRQPRISQPNFTALRIEFEAKGGFQQCERRGARPGLWRAGDRVQRRSALLFALKAAEQFGQPPQIHVSGGVEQGLEHALDRMFEVIARQPERDQRVVVRPYRPVVIRHRIIARLAARQGADAPACEKMRPHQIGGDHPGAIFAHHAAEQELSGVRRADPARLLGAVERQRVAAKLVAPERILKTFGEPLRFGRQLLRQIDFAEAQGAARRQLLAGEHIALYFGKCDIALGQAAIGMKDRIIGILPALIG